MLRTLLLAFSFSCLLLGNAFSQSLSNPGSLTADPGKFPPLKRCGAMEYLQQQIQADPTLPARRAQIEADMQQWIANNYNPGQRVIYNIPVVFHVVYQNATENISDARLLEQLDVLNKDFRKLNSDVVNVPSAWTSITADCEINFCLATMDPNGQPTSGITRTLTGDASFTDDDQVKYTSQGGKDAWPRASYLNIWVCDLSGGLLGYAQFPGGPAATDGVVLNYRYTGVTGATSPYNLGRTATHEVGHWLNLYHIWGDDGTSCAGSDQVSDTPNQAGENYTCWSPGTVRTDACTGSAPGIMWMNYMDYTDDACMYMFTNGQKARVQACMAGSRVSLASSLGCSGSSSVVANFTSNTTSGCVPFTVNFTDNSFGNPTTWNWSFPGGTPATSTSQNPSVTYSTPGNYNVQLIVSNGTTTDTLLQTNYISALGVTVGQALPFTETFESNSLSTNNWTVENPDGATTWAIVTSTGTTPGNKSCKMDFYNYSAIGQRDALITPYLNLSGYGSASLYFEHAYRRYNNGSNDSLIVYISTTCGTWTRLLSLGENGSYAFATGTNTTTNWTPSGSSQWCMGNGNAPCYTINLTPYIGNSSVKFKFEGFNDYGNNLYIDNINITGTVLAPVANFTASSTAVCAGSSVTFTDQSTNNPTSWAWNFGGGGTPNTSTTQNPTITFSTPGTYTVTLTATNSGGNDSEVRTNYITVYALPNVSNTPTQPACGNNNGAITANPSGGQAPYSYLWSNGGTTQTISGLAPGTYTVTLTDNRGCQRTASSTLTNVPGPSISISGTTASACSGATGGATTSLSGGTANFSYLWSNGQTTANLVNVAAGTYTVTVTDGNNCTATTTATVNNLNAPNSSITSVVHTTCGNNNGSALATASGGSGGYNYLWSNGATTAAVSGLGAGNYFVTVTDASTCQSIANVTINSSAAATVSISSQTDETCGTANGTATAAGAGGNGVFNFVWSNGQTSATATGLAAGNYTVTVTDGLGCSGTTSVTIAGTSATSASISSSTNAACGQNNGSATAAGSGGNGSFTYLWSNGANTATISNVGAGTYTVTVTDGNNCSATTSVTLTTTTPPTVNINSSNPACNGQNTGGATATASNGSGNYTYLWSNGATTPSINSLGAGSYTVTVTDVTTGCTNSASVTLTQPAQLNVAMSQTPATGSGTNDGTATATPTGGTSPYTYSWSNGGSTQTITNLAPGTYTVTVTDSKGCTKVSTITVTELVSVSLANGTFLDIYPNPNSGTFTLRWELPVSMQLRVSVLNALGQEIFATDWAAQADGEMTLSPQNLSKGVYLLQVQGEGVNHTFRLMVQ